MSSENLKQLRKLLNTLKKDKKKPKKIHGAAFRKDVAETIANIYYNRLNAKTPEEVKEAERKAEADIDKAILEDKVFEYTLRDGRKVIIMLTRC
jgi:hypothetical protein